MASAQADYAGELLAACCGSTLHLLRTGSNNSQDKAIPSANPYTSAFWNRNNKVIAAACENGKIELRYSNGTHMSFLPLSGATPTGGAPSRSIADMSWSMGSKRLAAASPSGLCVHDMTSKVRFHCRVVLCFLGVATQRSPAISSLLPVK
jgi:WD40 repeat protein